MPKLVDVKTNQLVDVPHEQAQSAFLSGNFDLPKSQPVVMADDSGKLWSADPTEVREAITSGNYRFASDAAIHEADLQKKYGEGIGNQAAAAGLGAANTLSFGAATPLLQESGLADQETLRELPQRNPGSYLAGEVAGTLAPLPGASGLISKAGHAASEALLKTLPKTTSFLGRTAAKAAASSAGGAVEGALFGAGQQVSELSLGDPNLTAQRVAAHIGLSGVLGGGLGALLGAGAVVVPEAANKAKEALGAVFSGIREPAEKAFAKAASFVSGKPAEDIVTALRNRGFDGSPTAVREFSDDLTKTLQEQHNSLNKASKEAFRNARPEESASLVAHTDAAPIYEKLSQIDSTLQEAITNMQMKPELYPARFPSKLQDIAAGFTRDVVNGNSAEAGFKALDDLKRNLDVEIKFGKIPSEESLEAKSLIKTLRSSIKDSLEDASIFGEAGARQAAFNNAFHEFKTAQDAFTKKFATKSVSGIEANYKIDPAKVNSFLNQVDDVRGASRSEVLDNYLKASQNYLDQIEQSHKNAPSKTFDKEALQSVIERTHGVTDTFEKHSAVKRAFDRLSSGKKSELNSVLATNVAHSAGVPYTTAAPLVGLYQILKEPGAAIQRLAALEAVVQKVSKRIDTEALSIFKPPTDKLAGQISSHLAHEDYEKNVKTLNNDVFNADAFSPKLENISAHFSDFAPNVAVGLQQSAVRGAQFLQSKIPIAPATYPLDAKWKPGATDIAKFNRYYQVVEDPLIVYKQIRSSMLTHESIETLRSVYPDLHKEMQRSITDAMSEPRAKRVPYATQVQLSLFLGQDLTASTASKAILSNQAILVGPPPQAPSAGGKVPVSAKLSSSNRFLTPMQQSTQRR